MIKHSKDNGPIAKIIFLIINERVQQELDIARPQLRSIKEAFDSLREESMLSIKKMQKLPDSEKPKVKPLLVRELVEGANALLAETLRPEQLKRYQQLRLQHEGIGAFLDEPVCSELSLTEEQITSLKVKAVLHAGPIARIQEQVMQEIMGMLTEQQAEKWQEMLGETFDFGETESHESNTPPGAVQKPISQGQGAAAPSHTPSTSLRAASAPAGDPFADDDVF